MSENNKAKPVLERLRNYFQGTSDVLGAKAAAFGLFSNKSDVGIIREDILAEFLQAHLPSRCIVLKGGAIFDSDGNESKQIDLIVANDLALQFQNQGKAYIAVEGCYAAISVKSSLDKPALYDTLANLASVPVLKDANIAKLTGIVKKDSERSVLELPRRYVFAFDGDSPETVIRHIDDFYKSHNNIELNRMPRLIVVNNKYLIERIPEEGRETRAGIRIAGNSFYGVEGHPFLGGFSLLKFLSNIQDSASYGSLLAFNFSKYVDNLPMNG